MPNFFLHKILVASLFSLLLLGCNATNQTKSSITNTAKDSECVTSNTEDNEDKHLEALLLELDENKNCHFEAYLDYDDYSNNQAGQMLYPGINAGTFLVSVLAHGAISKSMDESKKSKFIEESNAIIDDYKPVLNEFTQGELKSDFFSIEDDYLKGGLDILPKLDPGKLPKAYVSASPEFLISLSRRTIMLSNLITVYSVPPEKRSGHERNKEKEIIYQNTIVTINQEIDGEPEDYWLENDGLNLKNASVDLFGNSLKLFMLDFEKDTGQVNDIQESIKYYVDGKLKVERGYVVDRNCDRIIFRTLRGWMKSVPSTEDENNGCLT